MRGVGFAFLFGALCLSFGCPHKPVDPGTLTDSGTNLFSLPAPPTDGTISFRPSAYITTGSFEIKSYDAAGYFDQVISYDYVGSQVQYVKVVKANGTFTYHPKWVISGAKSAADVAAKKNLLIISILPAFDNGTTIDHNGPELAPATFYPNNLDCANPENVTIPNFCNNIMQGAGPFTTNNQERFYSYEGNLYSGCVKLAPSPEFKHCFKGLSNVDIKAPYDKDVWDPPAAPVGTKLHIDLGFHPGTNILAAGDPIMNPWKEFWYTDEQSPAVVQDNPSGRKFTVVIEFLDSNSNLFTTKFPYSGELDNLGNHTPAMLHVANFPDPEADVSGYTPATPPGGQHDLEYLRTDNSVDGGGSNKLFKNCTGLQSGSGTPPTKETGADQGTVITCDKVIEATAATINLSRKDLFPADYFADDDIIHKMQLAGCEFRAAGTDTDPRLEMLIRHIELDVQRGYDRFID